MVATMVHLLQGSASGTEYILPLYPFTASAADFGQATATSTASPAGMACSLGVSPLDDYFVHVRDGQRPSGRPIWPVSFDIS